MKITKVRFQHTLLVDGLSANLSIAFVGMPTDTKWGGGPVTSMFRNDQGDLCIKKATRFKNDGHEARQTFDMIVVPWHNVQHANYADDQQQAKGK